MVSSRQRGLRNKQLGREGEKRVHELLSKYGQCTHLGRQNQPDLLFKHSQIEVKTIKPRTQSRVGRIKIVKDEWSQLRKNQWSDEHDEVWLIVEVRTKPKEYYLINGTDIDKLLESKVKWLSLTIYQIRRLSVNGRQPIEPYIDRIS